MQIIAANCRYLNLFPKILRLFCHDLTTNSHYLPLNPEISGVIGLILGPVICHSTELFQANIVMLVRCARVVDIVESRFAGSEKRQLHWVVQ